MSLNAKLKQFNSAVEWFYSDDFSLDEAVKNYKKAISLEQEIESDLNNLKNEIKVLSNDFTKE